MINTIIGIGIATFLLMYFARGMEKPEHWGIQLLMYSFAFILLMLLGKAVIDGTTVCEPMINTATIVGNTTTYTYADQCVTTSYNTENSFFRLTLSLFGIYLAYIIYFLVWKHVMNFYEWFKKRF